MKKVLLLMALLFSMVSAWSQSEKNRIVVKGVIVDSDDEPQAFATIQIAEQNHSVQSDVNGKFSFSATKGETYTLTINSFNCVEQTIKVTAGAHKIVKVRLEKQTYALDEVVVMAQYKASKGSSDVINQQALEHIQPTSLQDVLTLIPGGIYKENRATSFNRISLRQSGSDNNTSLGTAVVVDGIPMDNDGYRASLPGVESSDKYSARIGFDKGIDLRTISTDHIQRIEVAKGISSAKLGNLTSGVLMTTSKSGATKWQVRVKTDPLTKLFYVSKGYKLSPTLGSLHAGVDYTSSYDDRRDPLNHFNRLTGQLVYNNSVSFADRNLFIFAKAFNILTLNQSKEDELTRENNETFFNHYNRAGGHIKLKLSNINTFLYSLEWISAVDYTYDLLQRNRFVQLEVPLPSPVNFEAGEHESIFLPTTYYSPFSIENKPLAIWNQINGESVWESEQVANKVIYGAEWKHTKNYGKGVQVDMERPPFPGNNEYVRPVPNNSIPALSTVAAYAENQLQYRNRYISYEANVGVRATKMLNLSHRYTQLNKLMVEPRINTALSFNIKTRNQKEIRTMIRLGYGEENKLPTLGFLYPDKVYRDLMILSAFTAPNSPYNHVITDTRIFDVVNYALRPNKNRKMEVGVDVEYSDFLLSLTAFQEFSNAGYSKELHYYPAVYYRYFLPKAGPIIDRKPQKSDYKKELYETFLPVTIVDNGAQLVKRGIEYRIRLPRIEKLYTNIEINGAFYNTEYGSSLPVAYHPSFKDNDHPMPYVGYYRKADVMRKRIFNTNVWFNTNIPRYKMVFSTFLQFIWMNDSKRINGDVYPYAYLNTEGQTHNITPAILEEIEHKDLVWRHYHLYKEPYFEKDPVSLSINFKVTKELNSRVRTSFFVNNIFDINPSYKNRYGQTVRHWQKPFFGAEITFNL